MVRVEKSTYFSHNFGAASTNKSMTISPKEVSRRTLMMWFRKWESILHKYGMLNNRQLEVVGQVVAKAAKFMGSYLIMWLIYLIPSLDS